MLRINPIKTIALAAALTASTAVIAQNRTHKSNEFLTEQFINITQNNKDEFVSQANLNNNVTVNVKNIKQAARAQKSTNPDFDKAVDYYNNKLSYSQRHSVTTETENNSYKRLNKMEQDINKAYQNCAAFNDPDIMVVTSSPYRYYWYPRWYDKLLKFDIQEMRERTTNDMKSLNEIRDKVEYIIEEANGKTKHNTPGKTDYDVDAIAKKHLGMSYEEFAAKYPNELEKCKYVTYADIQTMDNTMAYVYGRAKSYASEMLETTTLEAHNTHWDIQERKLYVALDASSDISAISDFEWDGITEEGLNEIQTGIMFKSFEDALVAKYRESNPNAINDAKADAQQKTPIKRLINGTIKIFKQNGVYDLNGHKTK